MSNKRLGKDGAAKQRSSGAVRDQSMTWAKDHVPWILSLLTFGKDVVLFVWDKVASLLFASRASTAATVIVVTGAGALVVKEVLLPATESAPTVGEEVTLPSDDLLASRREVQALGARLHREHEDVLELSEQLSSCRADSPSTRAPVAMISGEGGRAPVARNDQSPSASTPDCVTSGISEVSFLNLRGERVGERRAEVVPCSNTSKPPANYYAVTMDVTIRASFPPDVTYGFISGMGRIFNAEIELGECPLATRASSRPTKHVLLDLDEVGCGWIARSGVAVFPGMSGPATYTLRALVKSNESVLGVRVASSELARVEIIKTSTKMQGVHIPE